jgi:cobalt-zinc-cadmium efflux system protein
MAHTHHHHRQGHSHAVGAYDRAFAIGIGLNVALVAGQAVYGALAHSLALMADAGHNLSDVMGLVLAWAASRLATRRPTPRRTYGMGRASILAALVNAAVLLLACGAITLEALHRFQRPEPVAGTVVAWVAGVGILINGGSALLFLRGREHDINIHGAFLHMAADAGVSLAVLIAAVVIRYTGWLWLDPATSLAVVVVIIAATWSLLRESIDLALDAVPRGIDPDEVRDALRSLPGVSDVHDLHIWAMSTTEIALTAHLVCAGAVLDDALYRAAYDELREHFGIAHATLQLECVDACEFCHLAAQDVV